MKAHLMKIQKCCTHDGPGIRTTIFLKGCPLSCAWCHNPETKTTGPSLMFNSRLCIGCRLCEKRCPNHCHTFENGEHRIDYSKCIGCGECTKACIPEAVTICGRDTETEEIVKEALKDKLYYEATGGGVTISGGEPLMQPAAIMDIADRLHEHGVTVYLETSGYASEKIFDDVVKHIDGFLFDVKIMSREKHKYWTGVDNLPILRNFRKAMDAGCDVILRRVFIPGINDGPEEMNALLSFMKGIGYKNRVDIMKYHIMGVHKYEMLGRDYALTETHVPSHEEINKAVYPLKKAGYEIKINE